MRCGAVSSLVIGMLAIALAGCSATSTSSGPAATTAAGSSSVPAPKAAPGSAAPATPLPAPATVDDTGQPVSPVVLTLVRKIYLASAQADYAGLQQLLTRACFHSAAAYQAQIQLWHQPGMLHEMATVLLTHGAATDGYTYPGFALAGWHTHFDYEDSATLHVVAPPSPTSDASSYTGPRVVISFAQATGSTPNWCGITPHA